MQGGKQGETHLKASQHLESSCWPMYYTLRSTGPVGTQTGRDKVRKWGEDRDLQKSWLGARRFVLLSVVLPGLLFLSAGSTSRLLPPGGPGSCAVIATLGIQIREGATRATGSTIDWFSFFRKNWVCVGGEQHSTKRGCSRSSPPHHLWLDHSSLSHMVTAFLQSGSRSYEDWKSLKHSCFSHLFSSPQPSSSFHSLVLSAGLRSSTVPRKTKNWPHFHASSQLKLFFVRESNFL